MAKATDPDRVALAPSGTTPSGSFAFIWSNRGFHPLVSTQDVQASFSLQSRSLQSRSLQSRRQPLAPRLSAGSALATSSSLRAQATDIQWHEGCRTLRGLGW